MVELKEEKVTISLYADIARAKTKVREIALTTGFSPLQAEELVIVISELSSNILKHADEGQLIISQLDKLIPCIKIESHDDGPGITNIEHAIGDGFSTAKSLGCGLGAVNRLMDTLDVQSPSARTGGTYICCTKRLVTHQNSSITCPFSVGIASRPYPGLDINGDAFVSIYKNNYLLVGVIDGLGHGKLAHKADNYSCRWKRRRRH